ncbi:hypothetical protein LTR99_009941 [Exophiala xenobiotica]|uniref:Uncharacterized protein n=1 Tax=Vermiconidia calcicola TaxID=1690605 RepID=A0AAV9Q768_9PEZI|nr:hypothetical protein LTR92_005017 [Exophiala xenobiotica]KAK5528328.1 hypothetical protein LTR23_011059 [Chaetothyriales sp. CCFEE 6169]KAK5536757.1 hypothetical protein LTR25_005431 [Vermiconidia calcicola]KAK5293494.1 hypothetical protein LTR99_009941 [Exophiala xenobiotica]KAK5365773.1 hypothetical protein LTS13_008426 [Exophiala xenobiotica]
MASIIDSVTSGVNSILSSLTADDTDTDPATATTTPTSTPASASLTDSTFRTSAGTGLALTTSASSTQTEPSSPSSSPSEPATYYIQKYGLSAGAKAGIAIGAVIIFIMIFVAVLLIRRRRHQKRSYRLDSGVPTPPLRDVGDEAPVPVVERAHMSPVTEMYSPVIERLNPPPYSERGFQEPSPPGQVEHQDLSGLHLPPEIHGTSVPRPEGGYPSEHELGVTRSGQHSAELQGSRPKRKAQIRAAELGS